MFPLEPRSPRELAMSIVRPPSSRWKGTVVAPIESISERQREDFLEEYAETQDEAAGRRKANLSVVMFRRLLDEDPAFRADYEAVRSVFHGHAVEAIEDAEIGYAMKGNNPLSRQFILKHHKSERYGNKATVDINLSFEDVQRMTPEERAELKARIMAKHKCLPNPKS